MLTVEFCWFFLAASGSQKKKTTWICQFEGEIRRMFGKAYRMVLYSSCQMPLGPRGTLK